MSKPVILSGIQPSGNLHVGNYLGAVKNWLALQESGEYACNYMIVDYHTLTGDMTADERRHNIIVTAAEYIALGLDPEKSNLFVQSHVPENTELAWVFNSITPMAELERMTQYKDKSARQAKNINCGLFTYPVLQAADILMPRATHVPVGKDQVQHIELTRDIARWFNNRYGDYFPEPEALLTDAPKVMSLLEPESKMSKSRGLNHVIELADSPEVIEKKLKKAVTASEGGDASPGVANLLLMLKHFGGEELHDQFAAAEKDGSIRYGDLKAALAKATAEHFAEFREKREELLENHDGIAEVLIKGAEAARARAKETMEEVRKMVGVR